MKYKYIIFFCIIMILSVSAVSAADNNTEDVQLNDATGDLTDLQTLIDEDTSNYVNLTSNYVGDFNNKTVVINKNITIDGNGYTVDYLCNKPLFDIQASNITIENLIIKRHNTALGQKTVFTGDITESNPIVENTTFLFDNELPTIFANNITKNYKNSTQFYATIVDANNQTLANTTVTFYVNGVYYNRTTDSEGRAKLNINLIPGSYIITSKNTVTNETTQNIIEVISPFFMIADMEKRYKTSQYFIAILYGSNGQIAGEGEMVTFCVNGVYYNRTTSFIGAAALNIRLPIGEYTIFTTYKGYTVSNKIIIYESCLNTWDLVKEYGSSEQFRAFAYDEDGNRVGAGEEVLFNINGVDYIRTTDVYGVASLNINLMPGKYIISTSYKSSTNYNNVTVNPATNLTKID